LAGDLDGIYSVASLVTFVFLVYAFSVARNATTVLLFAACLGFAHHHRPDARRHDLSCRQPVAGWPHRDSGEASDGAFGEIWALAHLIAQRRQRVGPAFHCVPCLGRDPQDFVEAAGSGGEINVSRSYREIRSLRAVLGVVLWVLIIWKLHEWIIGVSRQLRMT